MPCIFSFERVAKNFARTKRREDLLGVLARTQMDLLWWRVFNVPPLALCLIGTGLLQLSPISSLIIFTGIVGLNFVINVWSSRRVRRRAGK